MAVYYALTERNSGAADTKLGVKMNPFENNVEILQNDLCFRELNNINQSDLILQLYDGHPLDQVLERASAWLQDIDFEDFNYYLEYNDSDFHC